MTVSCLACGATDLRIAVANPTDFEYGVIPREAADILMCAACQTKQQFPFPKNEDLSEYYADDYQNYVESKSAGLNLLNRMYQKKLADGFEAEFGKNVHLLDFGCGQGAFLETLARHGFENLIGFDFVEYPEAKANSKLTLLSSFEALKPYKGQLDVIRMNHVIEHLTDHQETMTFLAGLLKPGGVLIGETPNPSHYTASLWGRFWGPLHYPYHTVLFSPDGLRQAAPNWGMKLASTRGTPLPTGWALSLENWIKSKQKSPGRGRTKAYVFLMLAFLPLSLLDKLFNWSATANYRFTLTKQPE